MNLGKDTPAGFLPADPTLDEMLKRVGLGEKSGGWDALSKSFHAGDDLSPAKKEQDDLKRLYVQFAASPAGVRILEDLLDQTLRRGTFNPNPAASMEQEAMFCRERKGQNSIVVYILKMIHDGRKIPAPNTSSSKKKKII